MDSKSMEFNDMLLPGQRPEDRPDITCRIFIDKMRQFMLDLGLIRKTKTSDEMHARQSMLGPIKYWFYSVEHQKRSFDITHFNKYKINLPYI